MTGSENRGDQPMQLAFPLPTGEKAKAHDEVDHEPVRQAAAAAFGVPGFLEDFLNGGQRDDTFKGTQSLVSGQGGQSSQLACRSTHRGLLLGWERSNPILAGGFRPVHLALRHTDRHNFICGSARYWA